MVLKLFMIYLSLIAALLLSGTTSAADIAATLYQQYCTRCHGTEIYAPDKRNITSFDALERQVERCALALELPWNEREMRLINTFLNEQFYQFSR